MNDEELKIEPRPYFLSKQTALDSHPCQGQDAKVSICGLNLALKMHCSFQSVLGMSFFKLALMY